MLDRANTIQEQLIAWRRDFHMHPELGFEERRTSAQVARLMEAMGYRVRTGVGKTGVVAEKGSGKPIAAIRADMDALPIQETNQVPYASQTLGVKHACGHDSHTAMALGVGLLLKDETFPGTVRLLFQPSEEVNDAEGLSGAPRMVQDGALEGVDMVFALHVDPATPVGDIRIESGPASGGSDAWYARIIGKGGHGARPQDTVDPFEILGHVIPALYAIPSRRLRPFDPAIVSIGAVHGGQADNVIPDTVDLAGTLRYAERSVQQTIHAEIRHTLELAEFYGGSYELRFDLGLPPMINHPRTVEIIRAVGAGLLGPEHVLETHKELGAEDFGCFTEVAPGAMFVLGSKIEGEERYGHNPNFDIDERALPVGAALLAECVLRFLNQEAAR